MWAWLKWYVHNLFCAVDQVGNALLGGWADETLSSHSYRLNRDGKFWGWLMHPINLLFFWQGPGHCKRAYEHECERYNSPPEERGQPEKPNDPS